MKVYTKKNNGLRLLGEGMVFSKGQLMLKEQEVTLSQTEPTTPDKFVRNSVTALNQVGNAKKTVIPTNLADGNKTDDGNILRVNKSQALGKTSQIRQFVNQNKDTGAVEIVDDTKGTNDSNPLTTSEGKKNRSVMDEMRANSIPFTKTELTKFLKSI